MKSLDLFLPWVAPYVYGAPDTLIRQMLVDAAIEFAHSTSIAQAVVTDTVSAGVPDYLVLTPSQQELSTVLAVFYQDRMLKPASLQDIESGAAVRAGQDSDVESPVGTPKYYYQITPDDDSIYLWPRPDETVVNGLAIRAAFQPVRTASSLEDVLYDWVRDIAYGALARLMKMQGQSFSNPTLAEIHEKMFAAALLQAKNLGRRGNLRSSASVRPRAFA